jgi:hypothetical protein
VRRQHRRSGQIFSPFSNAEAAAIVLTNPQLETFGKIPEYKFCAAKVEPVVVPRRQPSSSISGTPAP